MKRMTMFVIYLMVPTLAMAFSGGPPDEKTGAPGENNCTQCHGSFPVNSGDGNLMITGPEMFIAGDTYSITVELADADQARWGFEITPLTNGTVTITDAANTQRSSSGGKTYVKHTLLGTYAGTPDGPVTWSFDWTAPLDPPDSVVFYAAGNAANNNGSSSGDYIYTTSFTSHQLVTGIDDAFSSLPSHISLGNYPNPFNASTTISYSVPVAGFVKIDVFDLTGGLITTLVNGYQSAGEHNTYWNASEVSSGVYFYKLTSELGSRTEKMVLVK